MTTPNTEPPRHDEQNRGQENYDRIESIRVLIKDLESVIDFEASQTLALSFLTEPETSSENTLVQVDESVDPLLEELEFWRAELESLEAKVVGAGRCNASGYSEYETTDTEQASVIDLAFPSEYPLPRIDKGKQRAEMIPESDIEDPEVVAELGPLAPECICCFDPVVFYRAASSSSTTYKEGLYIPQCNHIYCLLCFKSYIASKVGNSSFPISCAAVGCSIEITPSIASKYLQSDALTTYETKLLEFSIVNKFFCPNKKCSAVMDLGADKESLRILYENYPEICLTCSESVCVVCDVLWHKGMSCAQFQNLPLDERCKEDLEIHLMIKREKWTRCPKCHSPIDKVDGCNHVVCHCKCEFCWKCNKEYLSTTTVSVNNPHGQASCGCDLFEVPIEGPEFHLLLIAEPLQEAPRRQVAFGQRGRQIGLSNRGLKGLPNWLTRFLQHNQCHYCHRIFGSLAALDMHQSYTNTHEVYHCCGRTFQREADLERHKFDLGC